MNLKIYKIWLSALILFATSGSICAQNERHSIKADIQINELFSGNGLVFESIGYEYRLPAGHGHAIGFCVGGNFKTSKLRMEDEGKATTNKMWLFTADYYYFLRKHADKNGLYISPAAYYTSRMSSVDNERIDGYGIKLNIGYRINFRPVFLDCVLFSVFDYTHQKNDAYTYSSREIKPLNIKIVAGYIF